MLLPHIPDWTGVVEKSFTEKLSSLALQFIQFNVKATHPQTTPIFLSWYVLRRPESRHKTDKISPHIQGEGALASALNGGYLEDLPENFLINLRVLLFRRSLKRRVR